MIRKRWTPVRSGVTAMVAAGVVALSAGLLTTGDPDAIQADRSGGAAAPVSLDVPASTGGAGSRAALSSFGGCRGEAYRPAAAFVPPSTLTYIEFDGKQFCFGTFSHQKMRVTLQKFDASTTGGYWHDVSPPVDGRDTAGTAAYARGSVNCRSVGSGTFRTRGTGTVWPVDSPPQSRTGYSAQVNLTC